MAHVQATVTSSAALDEVEPVELEPVEQQKVLNKTANKILPTLFALALLAYPSTTALAAATAAAASGAVIAAAIAGGNQQHLAGGGDLYR